MRKPKLIEDYRNLLYDVMSSFAHAVVRQTMASAFIIKGDDLSKPLGHAVVALDHELATTDHPTPAQTAQRDLLRGTVITELNRLAKRLNLDYPGDEPALLSSGLTLADASGTAARTPAATATDAVMDLELLDGTPPGCLLLRLKRPAGTTQNLIRYTTDLRLPEEQWLVAVGGGRERQLGPFESGTKVAVKAAALIASTTEPQYSAVKSRIVQ